MLLCWALQMARNCCIRNFLAWSMWLENIRMLLAPGRGSEK